MNIDLASRKIADTEIANMVVEFPRVNDALNALPTRFVYLPTLTNTLQLASPPSATFNTMLKVNTETGAIVRHDFGNRVAGEATFVPRKANRSEDDGYLAIFAFDPVNRSERSGPARRSAHRRRARRCHSHAPARPARPARGLDSEGMMTGPVRILDKASSNPLPHPCGKLRTNYASRVTHTLKTRPVKDRPSWCDSAEPRKRRLSSP
jgi:hypothetical protein